MSGQVTLDPLYTPPF